jgi:hypothetical protein
MHSCDARLLGRQLRRKPHLQLRSLTYAPESNSAAAQGPGRRGRLLAGSNWSWKKVAPRGGTTDAGIR